MAAFVNFVGYPTGAKIFLDDAEIGVTPLYNYMIKWGKYQLRFEKEGYEPEERIDFRIFKTDHKKTVVVHLNKKNELTGG